MTHGEHEVESLIICKLLSTNFLDEHYNFLAIPVPLLAFEISL